MMGDLDFNTILNHLQREFSGAPHQLVGYNCQRMVEQDAVEVTLDFVLADAGPIERVPVAMAGSRYTHYVSGRREGAMVTIRFTDYELEDYLVGTVLNDRTFLPMVGLIRAALGNLRATGLREATVNLFEDVPRMGRRNTTRLASTAYVVPGAVPLDRKVPGAVETPLHALTRGPTREELEADYRV